MKRLIVLAAAAALLLSGCAANRVETEPVPELMEPVGVKVDTALVEKGELYGTTVFEGSVVAHAEELSFEIDGKIKDVNVYPGMWAEEGDVLLTLDQTDLGKQIDDLRESIAYAEANGAYDDAAAQMDIELIEVDIARMKSAAEPDAKAISLRELDAEQARLDLKQAQETRRLNLRESEAQLEILEKDYGRNEIRAPYSGHVFYETNINEGASVQAEKAVIYMANPNDLTLIVGSYLNERQIQTGRLYALIGDGRYEVEYVPMTREEMTSKVLSGETLTTSFRVVGPEDQLDKVKAGMYGALCVESSPIEDALQIPLGAVYTSAGSSYVYIQTEDGGRARRDIRTGRNNGINVQILEGLEEGEVVYVKE